MELEGPGDAAPLSVRHAAKRLGMRWVLRDVDFELAAGTVGVIVGPNGAGKSTLLKLAAGVWEPSRGQIVRFGEATRTDAGSARIGYLAHQSFLYGALSGLENLEFYGRLYGVRDPRGAAQRMLAHVGLARFQTEPTRRYSRGMQQRAAIARTFLHDPDLLLLDEPYTSLDVEAAAILDGMIRAVVRRGGAALLITHQWEEARRLAQWAAVLWQGRLVWSGPADPGALVGLETDYRRLFERRGGHGA